MIMPDAGAQPLLEVDITSKTRTREGAALPVIAGLRFTLAHRQVTCLLGPSGCGKTTALRIILGLDTDFEGRLTAHGKSPRLGVVFQDPRLLPWRTVEENIRLAAPRLTSAAILDLLAELGLAEWSQARPNQLSLGMARRAALARALAVEPDLLVLDEAFVSLDERSADALRAVTFAAVARRGASVLMVTHNIKEALKYSDTILVLAPRPTFILEALPLERARTERDAEWIAAERQKLLAAGGGFLDSE